MQASRVENGSERNWHEQKLDCAPSVMGERRDLNWLLIVQDTHFRNPEHWGSASPLLSRGVSLSLPHLDSHSARKLIVEPMRRCGIRYEEELLPSEILELTDGNPFLIHVLCYHLVNQVRRHGQTSITPEDLRQVVAVVTNDGARHFDHFAKNLRSIDKIIVAAIANASKSGEWIDISPLCSELLIKAADLKPSALFNAVGALERQGIVALQSDGNLQQVRIPIRLFHHWIRCYVDLDTAIEEWRVARAVGRT